MHVTRTDPSIEPVTIAEAKTHLQIEHDDDDLYIKSLIEAARVEFEGNTDRALITQTVTVEFDSGDINVMSAIFPIRPVITLTSFKYYTSDGVATAWTDGSDFYTYGLDPMKLVPDNSLFIAERRSQAFQMIASCGYGATADTVPKDIRDALLTRVSDRFWNESSVIPGMSVQTKTPVSFDDVVDKYCSFVIM